MLQALLWKGTQIICHHATAALGVHTLLTTSALVSVSFKVAPSRSSKPAIYFFQDCNLGVKASISAAQVMAVGVNQDSPTTELVLPNGCWCFCSTG
jgi:hypothetical protein